MTKTIQTIGILGAGKLGITLARIARHYGFDVNVAGSGDVKKISLTIDVLAPGAKAMTAEDAAMSSDVVVLALPLGKFKNLPKEALANKLVIDAMNHWWEVDGERSGILPIDQSSSEAVQDFLYNSRVVKAFNHIGYHDLFDEHRPPGAASRKAIAIAGDQLSDVEAVAKLVDCLGFEPLVIGKLREGKKLEPGMNTFGASVGIDGLKRLIEVQSS